jgi:hypothetical protein
MISQTKSPANQDASLDIDVTHTKSTNLPAEEGINKIDNHKESTIISQRIHHATEETSVDTVTTNISSATNMAKPQLDDELKVHKSKGSKECFRSPFILNVFF